MAEAANMSFGKSVVDVIRARKSIRTYRSDPIPDDLLTRSVTIYQVSRGCPVPIRFNWYRRYLANPDRLNPERARSKEP